MKLVTAKNILKVNDQLAAENRARFDAAGVFCVNVVGSPGCGKTTLLEGLFKALKSRLHAAVIEGDIAGSIDAERIEALGLPVVQINTDGACHLDANMVASAIRELDLEQIDLLVIENVGNLVCTAAYDLGEHLRIVVLSTSEGDDKAAKYPAIFQGSHALMVTKLDLLPHTNFNAARITADMKRLAPAASVLQVSALRGDGVAAAADWLEQRARAEGGRRNRKGQNRLLREVAKRYQDAIAEVLLREWDPIGVGDTPEAQDEYDSYVDQVHAILLRQEPRHKLIDFLWWAETEHMGLCGNCACTERIADRLLKLPRELDDIT